MKRNDSVCNSGDQVKTVQVKTESSDYEVIIGEDVWPEVNDILKKSPKAEKILIVYDETTYDLFHDRIEKIIQGYQIFNFKVKPGEDSKSLNTYGKLLEFAAEIKMTRTDAFIALGGGVIGDLTGFAAASYLRGVDYYQIPTTLLAAVDSSVGGKTGINLQSGKNLAGAFKQPKGVIFDPKTLKTLSDYDMANGISEIIKYGVIFDKSLFESVNLNEFQTNLPDIIKRCVEIKADIVNRDELDTGERQLLNFGHTLGHAIEKISDFEISHGHAVAMGMAMITKASYKKGLCEKSVYEVLVKKLVDFNLPYESVYDTEMMMESLLSDKKRTGDVISFVIPRKIGQCELYPVKLDEIYDFIKGGE